MRQLGKALYDRLSEVECRELICVLQDHLGIPRPATADDLAATRH
jgi:hypothetical protein